MPRTQEQNEQIRESRRKQIMETAMEMFAREGYGHVSISSLAKQAGISKGLMYNYFESKEQLLQEIIHAAIQEIMQYFDPNHDGVLTREEFALFIRKTFQLMHQDKEHWLKFFGLVIQPNVMQYLQNSAMVEGMDTFFEMFYLYFKQQGFEDPELEMLNLAVIIEGLGMVTIFYQKITEIPDLLLEKLEDRIIKMYT